MIRGFCWRVSVSSVLFAFQLHTFALAAPHKGDKDLVTQTNPDIPWSYKDSTGPDYWGSLTEDSVCSNGTYQSPVGLITESTEEQPNITVDPSQNKLVLNWNETPLYMMNNGRTIQVRYEPGSTLTVDGEQYSLSQFHFHSPSEHTIDGQHFPLEAHFVHTSRDQTSPSLFVAGVLFQEGPENDELNKLWFYTPDLAKPGSIEIPNVQINASHFIPSSLNHFRYEGSLTTPPCTEGVDWLVFATPIPASRAQLNILQTVFHGPTNRPVQPLFSRKVLGLFY